MSLDRFKHAQASADAGFDIALAELRAGGKTSHWIWYVFPQLAGLGRSPTARLYGLRDLNEACAYLRDPELRDRLMLATGTVAEKLAAGVPLIRLMGGTTDALKLVSSLTLFERAAAKIVPEPPSGALVRLRELCVAVLEACAAQGFPRCEYTGAALGE